MISITRMRDAAGGAVIRLVIRMDQTVDSGWIWNEGNGDWRGNKRSQGKSREESADTRSELRGRYGLRHCRRHAATHFSGGWPAHLGCRTLRCTPEAASGSRVGGVRGLAVRRRGARHYARRCLVTLRMAAPTNAADETERAGVPPSSMAGAEAYIALGIARGETLASIAIVRGITVATARTQLKSVFSKLGTHRQSQLVALLSRSLF